MKIMKLQSNIVTVHEKTNHSLQINVFLDKAIGV